MNKRKSFYLRRDWIIWLFCKSICIFCHWSFETNIFCHWSFETNM